jgi:arylsulfatase A-like enzyme
LLLLAATAAACAKPGAPPRPAPLLSISQSSAVDWPPGCEPPARLARTAEDLAPYFETAPAVRRLRLTLDADYDERIALLAPAGASYRIPFDVPAASALTTAIGRLRDGHPLRLVARILEEGRAPVVLDERELPAGAAERWESVTWDLGRWSGRSVTLELASTSSSPGGGGCESGWAAWSEPRLVPRKRTRDPHPNVIWISVDTLRADRLGVYGAERPTSPELDKLARSGVRFEWAISQAPWTKPSHRSMLTGFYPSVRDKGRTQFIGVPFHRAGYRTFAITGAGQIDSSFGFDRGFEIYRLNYWIHDPATMLDWVVERADSPFFLFLHTYETHEPYTHTRFVEGMPGGRFQGEFSKKTYNQVRGQLTDEEKVYVKALYDGDIAYTDAKLGILFADLEKRGLLDNTILIVTSDHGEQFWDNGTWGHGQSMWDHQIRVPLIVRLPPKLGFPAARVETDQIELLDLYPTVLDLAGVPLEQPVQGRSIRKLFEAAGPLPPKPAFAEHTNVPMFERRALRTPRFKLIISHRRKAKGEEPSTYELFDLRADPREQIDLSARFPDQVARLEAELYRRMSRDAGERDEEVPENVDGELRKQLEALGYIGN